ncbi:MAG: hypothetical protein WA484_05370 [Solirubrobacteraceae bacterium]
MLGRLATLAAVLTLGLAPGNAAAAPRDVASTHAYLVAAYTALHATVTKWSAVEASLHKLDLRFHAECANVGAGSPQSDEEQKLSSEVAGALWATSYHTDAKIVQRFVRAVSPLRWSNPAITSSAHRYATALHEMTMLPIPDLCGDVRSWAADGFKAVSASTEQYDRRVEAIVVKEVPRRLLAPYVQPSDRGLRTRDEHLATRFEELEFTHGQDDWNMLLETLALNQ